MFILQYYLHINICIQHVLDSSLNHVIYSQPSYNEHSYKAVFLCWFVVKTESFVLGGRGKVNLCFHDFSFSTNFWSKYMFEPYHKENLPSGSTTIEVIDKPVHLLVQLCVISVSSVESIGSKPQWHISNSV